jgi:hypothetical protein
MNDATITLKERIEGLRRLEKVAARLHRLYEKECNGYPTEQAEVRAQKAIEKLERDARMIAIGLRVYVYLQGDPRGPSVYVSTEPMSDADYNSRGFAL